MASSSAKVVEDGRDPRQITQLVCNPEGSQEAEVAQQLAGSIRRKGRVVGRACSNGSHFRCSARICRKKGVPANSIHQMLWKREVPINRAWRGTLNGNAIGTINRRGISEQLGNKEGDINRQLLGPRPTKNHGWHCCEASESGACGVKACNIIRSCLPDSMRTCCNWWNASGMCLCNTKTVPPAQTRKSGPTPGLHAAKAEEGHSTESAQSNRSS